VSEASRITRLAAEAEPADDESLATLYPNPTVPWLRVNFVASIDGAVEVGGVSAPLSSPPDQRVLRLLRRQCDALLIGAGTFRQERYGPLVLDEYERAWRRDRGLAEHPALVVVSGRLALDPAAPAFAQAPTRPIVLAAASAPAPRRRALAATADVITVGEGSPGSGTLDLAAALPVLHRRGLRQVLCEGGPHLLGALTAADLVDEVCLTVSPVLAGAGAGRIAAGAASPLRHLSLRHVLAADGVLLLRYRRGDNG
jgi:riboflavin biosynthesis pyrimidine reductase